MRVAHRNYVIEAEQFVPGVSTPKMCKGYGNHATEFSAYVKIGGKTKKLKPETWVVNDGFGNISLYSPEQFKREFIEVGDGA